MSWREPLSILDFTIRQICELKNIKCKECRFNVDGYCENNLIIKASGGKIMFEDNHACINFERKIK